MEEDAIRPGARVKIAHISTFWATEPVEETPCDEESGGHRPI